MQKVFLWGLWLVPLSLWGCADGSTVSTGGGGNGAGAGSSNLPCDVATVIKAQCQSCHGAKPLYGAPMPLVSAADFAVAAKSDPTRTVAELVSARIHDAAKPMPPPPKDPLDAAALAAMDEWIAAGAPAGQTDSCSGGGGGGSGGSSVLCTPDIALRAKTPWVMPKSTPDDYVCIGVDVTVSEKKHVTAILPFVDNSVILHHMLLYEVTSPYDPNPQPCNSAGPANSRLISVWAPGSPALELPPEAGFPIEGVRHYMMQMHYSNLMALEGEQDLSGFDVCTTTNLRPNEADILAFGSMNFTIPPHSKVDRVCDLTVPSSVPTTNVFYSMPHLHKYGTIISAEVIPPNGPSVVLSHREPWNFETQYWDSVSAKVSPGDVVRTRCVWENTSSQTVAFGETTSDEMCYVFAAYWPRLTLPGWSWTTPVSSAQCTNVP